MMTGIDTNTVLIATGMILLCFFSITVVIPLGTILFFSVVYIPFGIIKWIFRRYEWAQMLANYEEWTTEEGRNEYKYRYEQYVQRKRREKKEKRLQ